MVLWALENSYEGRFSSQKSPAIGSSIWLTQSLRNANRILPGIRPGERFYEEMITNSDSFSTVDLGRYFAILPAGAGYSVDSYCALNGGARVPPNFSYNSGTRTKNFFRSNN